MPPCLLPIVDALVLRLLLVGLLALRGAVVRALVLRPRRGPFGVRGIHVLLRGSFALVCGRDRRVSVGELRGFRDGGGTLTETIFVGFV